MIAGALRAGVVATSAGERVTLAGAASALPPEIAVALRSNWPSGAQLSTVEAGDLTERTWFQTLSATGTETPTSLGTTTRTTPTLDLNLWDQIEGTVEDLTSALSFQERNHDAITEHYKDKRGGYLDGTETRATRPHVSGVVDHKYQCAGRRRGARRLFHDRRLHRPSSADPRGAGTGGGRPRPCRLAS